MATSSNLDAIEILQQDHLIFTNLLEKIAATTERAEVTREELFSKLKLLLDAHAHIEETIFYPAIEAAKETHRITLEGYEEHAVVKSLLTQLKAQDHQTEEWTAKFSVLKENLEHHIKEEEKDMFPHSKKVLSTETLEKLGQAMRVAKEKFLQK